MSIDVRSETVSIDTADGPMPSYTAHPDAEPKGAIVVIQEAFGVTTHIQDVANRLARAGWLAIAPALFHRQGSPAFAYTDIESVMPLMGQLTKEGITTDLEATFDHLEASGFSSAATGIIGFCMGGTVSFYAGTLRPLGASVTYYGGGVREGRFGFDSLIDLTPHLKSPWLGLFGDLDKGIPSEDVEALRSATKTAPVAAEIVRYADAEHGFNCTDRPSVYNPEAAADAWSRTLTWFGDHVAS